MKAPIREGEFWTRSAVRHAVDGAPVTAWVSQTLARDAEEARNEFDEVRELAIARHKTALFNEAVRLIQLANRCGTPDSPVNVSPLPIEHRSPSAE